MASAEASGYDFYMTVRRTGDMPRVSLLQQPRKTASDVAPSQPPNEKLNAPPLPPTSSHTAPVCTPLTHGLRAPGGTATGALLRAVDRGDSLAAHSAIRSLISHASAERRAAAGVGLDDHLT